MSSLSHPLHYPISRRTPVTETLHGVSLTDPYRWLEDGSSPEVAAWTAAQNHLTDEVLGAIPQPARFAARLDQLLRAGSVSAPKARGARVFFLRRGDGQSQPVLCLREGDGPERTILDPNAANARGTTALDWWYPSPDGRLVAFGYSDNGDEWSTLHVLDVERGELLSERIPRTRYASIAWEPDSSGFYYTRYPQPGEVPAGEENYHSHLFQHRLGRAWQEDPVVFGPGRPMREMKRAHLSQDGRWLIIQASEGWARVEILLQDRQASEAGFRSVTGKVDAWFDSEVDGATLYLLTNEQAPRGRVVAVDLANPAREGWRELVPQHQNLTLQAFAISGGKLLLTALEDAQARLLLVDPSTGSTTGVPLPAPGSVSEPVSDGRGHAYVEYEAFTVPPTIFRVEMATGAIAPWAAGECLIDPESLTVRQVFYTSKDGSRVPMYIVHRKDVALDGNRPAVLHGYGGFNISKTPVYASTVMPWLERGGIYAVACLRGGGEYGDLWHRAGMLGNKQNVFDDYIAAAEYLVAAGFTCKAKLGIFGRSNGGLLVGAALTQRPDLFGAVVCGVPLLDMLHYHRFLIGALWIPEYGSSEDAEQFQWLHAYSPYQRVHEGVKYPPLYIFTAASDSRVDPLHARKMTALMQQETVGGGPVLLRVEFEAGHGVGKPLAKVVAEQAEIWGFFAWQLGL